ncbi:MAG: LLM class F420-dependent oxidoreductase, partial [Candidatus Bathyarchaeia archaeon]
MKIGLQVYHFDWPGSPRNISAKLVEIAKTADNAGFFSLWVMDHFFQVGQGFGPPEAPMLEGYSTISYLAAVTQSIKVGLMVTGNFYRHPGILIKTVTTLDVLSGGRAYLGIGAGWYEREAKGLGVPFPPVRERIERLEETLQIAKHMWRRDQSPFKGKYYQLEEPINNPQPLSQPHPPILIGGEGEKKMLRLVAKYGDACNFQLGTPLKEYALWLRERYQNREEDLARKLNLLKDHCNRVGRSYNDIERTVLGTIKLAPNAMSSTEVVELCQELAEIGFQHVIFNMPNVHEIEP